MHPTQKIRKRPDGTLDLTFTCQQSFEVTAWVASWRENVTVLAPSSLRAEMGELGHAFVARYATAQHQRPRKRRAS